MPIAFGIPHNLSSLPQQGAITDQGRWLPISAPRVTRPRTALFSRPHVFFLRVSFFLFTICDCVLGELSNNPPPPPPPVFFFFDDVEPHLSSIPSSDVVPANPCD